MSIVINNNRIDSNEDLIKYRKQAEMERLLRERQAEKKRRKTEESKIEQEEISQSEERKKEIKLKQEENEKRQKEESRQELLEEINSFSHVEMVEQIGRYKLCDVCSEENEKTRMRIYPDTGKKGSSVRICRSCSRLFFQCNTQKRVPSDIWEKVVMDDEMAKIYDRMLFKKQLQKDKRYFINNPETPIHVQFIARLCRNCGASSEQPLVMEAKAYDKKERRFSKKEMKVFLCVRCGQFQMEAEKYNELCQKYILFHDLYAPNGEKLGEVEDLEKNYSDLENWSRTFNLDRTSESLIRVPDHYCVSDNHRLFDGEGVVNVMNTEGEIIEVRIPVAKCIACNRYYIHETEYKKLKQLGIIMCRIEDRKAVNGNWSSGFSEWNQESILHMYGYNVSSTVNLSEEQRHTILKMLVAKKILSKFSIVDHLEFLINLNKDKSGFTVAIKKWKKDIEFLQTLSVEIPLEEIEVLKVVKHLNWIHK